MGYGNIFWGLLFFFDLRFNGFDLLPNFIGYILIYNGLKKLPPENDNFISARHFAFPLIFLSIPGIYHSQQNLQAESYLMNYLLFNIMYEILLGVLNIILIYKICMGIAEEAAKRKYTGLAKKAEYRWRLYAAYCIVYMILLIFPYLLIIITIPMFIFSLVALVLLMGLMKEAENSLTN